MRKLTHASVFSHLTTPLERRMLEKSYLEYLQNHEHINTQHQ